MYKLIALGVSAGGLQAVCTILSGLSATFPVPIALVQHRARESDALALVLQSCTGLQLCEMEDKMPYRKGSVFVAPPDYHALVDDSHFSLSVDAPVIFSRPSIDVFFESAADELGRALIGVVLTGANRDGARGLRRIADRGGHVLIQDPRTAEVPVMPRAALQAVPEARVVPLEEIAHHLWEVTGGRP